MTTTNLLETSDKMIDQIQSILQSKEAKNINKKTTRAIKDLAIVFRSSNNYDSRPKKSRQWQGVF